MGVMQRLEDLNTVLGQTNDHRHRVLVAAAKNIKMWFVKVRKIKAIYHTLNYFNLDVTQKCLIAECWIPTVDIEAIQRTETYEYDKSLGNSQFVMPALSFLQLPHGLPGLRAGLVLEDDVAVVRNDTQRLVGKTAENKLE